MFPSLKLEKRLPTCCGNTLILLFLHPVESYRRHVSCGRVVDGVIRKPVRIDKPACKQLAKALQPELERLVDLLERNLEEQKQVIDAFVEQRNKLSDKDLLQSVHKKVMTDDIIRKGGEYSGVCSAVQLIRKRLIEFINISSMKGG